MTNKHGAFWTETPTSLQPLREVDSVPFVIGSAPKGPVSKPILLTSYDEALEVFGEEREHTLCEAADVFFRRYQVGPVVFVRLDIPEGGGSEEPLYGPTSLAEPGEDAAIEAINLVDEVYPRFQKVVGMILMPIGSSIPSIAQAMATKAANINKLWRCVAVIDVDSSITDYTEIAAWKQANNLVNERMILCWPKVIVGGDTHAMSTHLAALMLQTDADNDGIPYVSPSNKNLKIQGAMAGGQEMWLGWDQANILNQAGIVTALNFQGGWKAWGNRTAAYPDSTDVKDTFVAVRRMFDWVGNTLVKSFWNRVDFPLRRRTIESIADSVNVWFNGLVSQEYILDGKIEYRKEDNPYTAIIDGKFKFRVSITPPSPAEEIVFSLEYDPEVLETLFGS